MDPLHYIDILTSTLFSAPAYQTYGGLIARGEFEPAGVAATRGLKDIRPRAGLGSDRAAAFVRQSCRNILGRGLRQPNDLALPRIVFATVDAERDLQVLAFL